MIANRENLDGLFRAYSTVFNKAQEDARARVHPNQLTLEELAMLVPSAGAATTHAWMNQIPSMREWIGDRVVGDISAGKLTVTNRDYENTVGVSRNDIEDDQYGAFSPLIAAMGAAAEGIWMELALEALLANAAWADGSPFFCAGRVLGGASGAMTNATQAALSRAAVEAAVAAMGGWLLNGGRPAGVTPSVLVVGPSQLGLAKEIVEADLIASGGTTISNVSTARMLRARSDARLVGAAAGRWFVLGDKHGIRPVAVQQRKQPKLTRMDADSDEAVFMTNTFRYGTDARGEGFLTLPFLAYAGGLTSVAAWVDSGAPPAPPPEE